MSAPTTSTPSSPAVAPESKRSAVEGIKENSLFLRGGILQELAADSDHFSEQDKQLIKFHGSYQQEDRDARKQRRKEGVGKYYMFMVRCKIPGGKLTAAQYLAVDDLASQYGNNTLRFTTRQGIQLHGILKGGLKETIAGINQCLLTTLGACGDVERNVMAPPAPLADPVYRELQETAALISAHLAPRSNAYHEIWLNGKPVDVQTEVEPIYGKVYLPRKFKTGLTVPEDNSVDIYAQDLGFLAIVEHGRIVGYNVLVGGGMGMTHGNANTFPHLAKPICYIPAKAVLNTAEAVVKLFRDHGNRADRKRARIKYVVHDWGVEKFRDVLSEYIGGTLTAPRDIHVTGFDPHIGWHLQGDGKFYYGLSIENGRVKDEGSFRLRSAIRAILTRFQPGLRITPNQDLLLCGLEESAKPDIDHILTEHGVKRPDQVSRIRQLSMACPAIPTCGLAITESERALPGVIDQLEAELARLDLAGETITVRMTGCPNGCARPYQSDIGLVGRSGDKYLVYVGGRALGDQLNFPLRDLVPRNQIVPLLTPLLADFKKQRQTGEVFGDYCQRLGLEKLQALLPEAAGKPGHGKAQAEKPAVKPEANGPTPLTASNGHLETTPVSVNRLSVKEATPAAGPTKRGETFLAGSPGEELPDYTVRYHIDGSVRETVVFFYEGDRRAAQARPEHPLRREAVYQGQVNPNRLHAARKLSDIFYTGPAGHERRDYRMDYQPDGQVAQTVIFFYEGDTRAQDASAGATLRRQVAYQGAVET